MKKFLAALLALCMILTTIVVVSAEGADEWVKTKKKKEFTFTAGETVTAGKIMFDPAFREGESINLNDYKYVDLAIYAYGADAIGDADMAFEMTSSGTCDQEENCYSFKIADLGLENGWNVVRLPIEKFITGQGANIEKINFMRLFSTGNPLTTATGDSFLKLYSVSLNNNETKAAAPEVEVTLPDFVPPEVKEAVYVETTYEVEFNKTFEIPACTIAPAAQFNINQVFDNPQDMTDVEYLELHLDVDKPAQFEAINFEFELTSGGACDAFENCRSGGFTGLTAGKTVVQVPIADFTHTTGGGFDIKKIDYIRMYGNSGTVTEAFTVTVEKVVFVNTKNIAKPNYETGSTGNEYGAKDIVVVSNCEDGAGFQNGSATTEIFNRGAGSQTWTHAAGDVPCHHFMFTYKADTPVDATGMNRFVFDLYVNNAAALQDVGMFFELTSAGTCDQEEYQSQSTFAKLTLDKQLVDGWNTCYINIEGAPGCDFSRFNYFRFFQVADFSIPTDLVICFDNVRFENYVPEPAPSVAGVETHQFTVFAADEEAYLLRTSAGNNGNQRFSDAQGETVYKFTVKNRYGVDKVIFSAPLGAQLLLQVSQDDATWTTIFEQPYPAGLKANEGGLKQGVYEYDITELVDLEACADIYIRVADCHPVYVEGDLTPDGAEAAPGGGHGWGGSIYKSDPTTLTVNYTPLPAEDLDAKEMYNDENSVAIHGFNKPAGGMELDNENQIAGSGCNSFAVGAGKVCAIPLPAPVDATGMDTLTFDLYVSDVALFDMFFGDGMNSGLELTSSGTWDKSEISWNLAGIRDNNLGGELKNGWNHIVLPLETAGTADGDTGPFDISAVNFIRFFMVGAASDVGIEVKIDNMRLDNSGIARAAEQLAKDTAVAEKVIKLINDIGEVTLDSGRAIEKAEKALKELTASQKALVENKDALKAAREAYDALVKEQEEKPEDPKPEDPQPEDPQPEDPQPEDPQPEDPQPEEPEKKGCGKSITIGAGAMMLLAAAWVTMTARKKED